jgi:alpha-D-ribose 1-methylphosphonate 5-triphosphate synthase subunit PhnG
MHTASSVDNLARKLALDTLAAAPSRALAELWDSWADKPTHTRLRGPEVGLGYNLGRDLAKAEVIAIIDALWQRDPDRVEAEIIAPLQVLAAAADQTRRDEAAATRVDFFTMVRGDN